MLSLYDAKIYKLNYTEAQEVRLKFKDDNRFILRAYGMSSALDLTKKGSKIIGIPYRNHQYQSDSIKIYVTNDERRRFLREFKE
jgi:hypothetical protein